MKIPLTVSLLILAQKVSKRSLLPCDFTAWDKNGDNVIDMEEFSTVGYPIMRIRDLVTVFQTIDTDGKFQPDFIYK